MAWLFLHGLLHQDVKMEGQEHMCIVCPPDRTNLSRLHTNSREGVYLMGLANDYSSLKCLDRCIDTAVA